ncbi:MAG: hypothetical protein KAJ69_06580, partial [Thermoplasmatales archaeon]|nr:hypothetical protein [Thermoplasmatales archaeon]
MEISILKKSMILILTLILLSLFIIITIPSEADIFIFVDDNAESSWYDETHVKTIQEAINNASIGAEIFVYNGT